MYLLVKRTGADISAYYRQVLLITGLTGILASVPCVMLYRGDYIRRDRTGITEGKITGSNLKIWEILEFLVIGAFLGQYGNMFVGMFQQYLNPEVYQETQSVISDGKSIWTLMLWMGIVAPFAEEVIFRWMTFLRMRDNMRVFSAAILSGLAFGIYHMNLLQGVYASIMGTLFALLLEWRGNLFTSVLLHMGANIWSLVVTDVMLYLLDHFGAMYVITFNLVLVLFGAFGIWKTYRNYQKRKCTRVI